MTPGRRVSDLTVDELLRMMHQKIRTAVREALAQTAPSPARSPSLDDFPVDDLGPWPEGLTLRREEMYGDDER